MLKTLAVGAFLGHSISSVVAISSRRNSDKNVSVHSSRTLPHAVAQLNTTRVNTTSKGTGPCQCEASNAAWTKCTRTVPKCIFVDLGAADGNSFSVFLNDGYGALSNCPSGGLWEAMLVEANPRFTQKLQQSASRFPGAATAFPATAAYMCEGQTSFFLDTVTTQQNYWGSSMSSNHPDVVNSGKQKVTVNTVNLNRMLYEHTTPGDYVLVKMDIEGAEYDIVPCLASSPSAALLDALWLEQHDVSWGLSGNSLTTMDQAKHQLQAHGVYMPAYHSQTLFLAKKQGIQSKPQL